MSTTHRSKTGCWTCRLRRKKCQEGGLPCLNCEQKGIFCHGYGPKPDWKDRGAREREEANRLSIGTRRQRRRTQSMASLPAIGDHARHATANNGDAPQRPQSDANLDEQGPIGATNTSSSECALREFDLLLPSPFHPNRQTDNDLLLHGLEMSPGELPTPTMAFTDELWSSVTREDALVQLDRYDLPDVRDQQLDTEERFTNIFTGFDKIPLTAQASDKEMDLIMQLIDEHAPFRYATQAQRGWLLALLMRSPTFFHASLSISAYCESLMPAASSETRRAAVESYQKYRSDARSTFTSMKDTEQPLLGEPIICGIQLAHLEALGKNMQDCQFYLDSAAKFFEDHEEQLIPELTNQALTATRLNRSLETKALAYFCSLLIWNDVLSCLVHKKAPSAAEAYKKLLSAGDFAAAFRESIGCESWAMSMAIAVVSLDHWKREQESKGNLSVRQLVSEAEEIEQLVESGIRRLNNLLPGGPILTPPHSRSADSSSVESAFDQPPLDATYVQTYVFLHALLVEVHVIVSGPSAGVPEIRKSIDRAVLAWKLRPYLLHNAPCLGLSFCATSSLASGTQRDFFREMVTDLGLDTLHDLKPVIEKCWAGSDRRSANASQPPDWKEVLQRSSTNILFLYNK